MVDGRQGGWFIGPMFEAINGTLLDTLAAVARKDYDVVAAEPAGGGSTARTLASIF